MATRQQKKGRDVERPVRTARGAREAVDRAPRAAIGLEAEFATVLDGEQVKPEDVFRSPANIIRGPMMHRTGKSYHLPSGCAIYFDTGVVELATPMIELEPGCAARAGRSLWESILFLRDELDAWERAHGHDVHLAGFSAHYNISFDLPDDQRGPERTVDKLAILLVHVLPFPVMLLGTNRKSTGIGLRPRGNRVEITADFTPDPALMIATATLIVGIVREVMAWPSYELDALRDLRRELPVVRGFRPGKHKTRRGWVARWDCFPENPFAADVNAPVFETEGSETLSVREIARRITRHFWPGIERLGDPRSTRLIRAVMSGRSPSLLELDDRPPSYDQVGRLCTWAANLYPERVLGRSLYERVVMRTVAREPIRIDGSRYTPVGMRGWTHVVLRRETDRRRQVFSLEDLIEHLPAWGRRR